MIVAGCAGIQGCLADTTGDLNPSPSPSLSPVNTIPNPTISPTLRTTIAPIHTKEPIIKPPIDQPSGSPSITPVPDVPVIKPTPTTVKPTNTPPQTSENPGDNQSAITYFQWGIAYQNSGDYEAAIREYDRAIAREPYFTEAWYNKALSYENLGLWDEAYQAYRFLLTIDPGYPAELNVTGISANTTQGSDFPPGGLKSDEPPLLWIAFGASVAGLIAIGIVFYYRRKRSDSPTSDNESSSIRTSPGIQKPFPDINRLIGKIRPYYSGSEEVLGSLIRLSIEIAREGREGKPIGTAFILGDSDAVLERSRQLILNPLAGHSEAERLITSCDMRENIKELALVDGAFVIREDGMVEAAGRYISIDTSSVRLPKGFGTRHVSVAAITQETEAIGIVVSESGGLVRVFAKGKVIAETM